MAERLHLDLPAVLGAVADRFVLGTTRAAEGYGRCRTFVGHAMAFEDQAKDRTSLDALHQLRDRYPVVVARPRAQEKAGKAA